MGIAKRLSSIFWSAAVVPLALQGCGGTEAGAPFSAPAVPAYASDDGNAGSSAAGVATGATAGVVSDSAPAGAGGQVSPSNTGGASVSPTVEGGTAVDAGVAVAGDAVAGDAAVDSTVDAGAELSAADAGEVAMAGGETGATEVDPEENTASAETASASVAPPCAEAEDDVVIVGDSYVNWITHTFLNDLYALSDTSWPSYAVGGASMATGGISGFIPDQFTRAMAEHPNAKAVIMTGGGNDILIPDGVMFPEGAECTRSVDAPLIEDCKKIVRTAVDRASSLISEAADKGVEDVIYFFYPEIPGGGIIGDKPNYILHYALPLAKEVCDLAEERSDGRLRCHFVDTIPAFEGQTGLFADAVSDAGDGIHPNSKGSKVIAAEVWQAMQDNCVGQPVSSGCCTP